jgi:hypothetical protein
VDIASIPDYFEIVSYLYSSISNSKKKKNTILAGSLSIKENPIDLAMMEFRFYESLTGIYEIGEIKIDTELILRDATGTELIKQS